MPAVWDRCSLRPPTHPQGRMGPLAPAPAAARATAALGGDSCAGKCKPAPSRQPLLPYAPASPSAHSIPHAGEGANNLAACWALGNNSANILACLLNTRPFASFFFPLLHPAQVSALSLPWAVPALHTQALGDHQSIRFASDILESPEQGVLREIPAGRRGIRWQPRCHPTCRHFTTTITCSAHNLLSPAATRLLSPEIQLADARM